MDASLQSDGGWGGGGLVATDIDFWRNSITKSPMNWRNYGDHERNMPNRAMVVLFLQIVCTDINIFKSSLLPFFTLIHL